jgi:hypothetical protein
MTGVEQGVVAFVVVFGLALSASLRRPQRTEEPLQRWRPRLTPWATLTLGVLISSLALRLNDFREVRGPALVAAHDLGRFQALRESDIKVARVPQRRRPKGALSEISAAVDRTAARDIPRNTVLVSKDLTEAAGPKAPSWVLGFQVSEADVLGAQPRIGSILNLIVIPRIRGSEGRVIEDVTVVGMDRLSDKSATIRLYLLLTLEQQRLLAESGESSVRFAVSR